VNYFRNWKKAILKNVRALYLRHGTHDQHPRTRAPFPCLPLCQNHARVFFVLLSKPGGCVSRKRILRKQKMNLLLDVSG
jgi:hypothetical protein